VEVTSCASINAKAQRRQGRLVRPQSDAEVSILGKQVIDSVEMLRSQKVNGLLVHSDHGVACLVSTASAIENDCLWLNTSRVRGTAGAVAAERQASAGARDGVKGKGAISLRALRCMR